MMLRVDLKVRMVIGRRVERVWVGGWLALFIAVTSAGASADITGRVVAVTDGDTIKVLDDTNTEHKVRLTGIDEPEMGGRLGLHRRGTWH